MKTMVVNKTVKNRALRRIRQEIHKILTSNHALFTDLLTDLRAWENMAIQASPKAGIRAYIHELTQQVIAAEKLGFLGATKLTTRAKRPETLLLKLAWQNGCKFRRMLEDKYGKIPPPPAARASAS